MKEVNIEQLEKAVENVITKSFKVRPKKDLDYVVAKMKLYKAFLEIKKEEILAIS